MREHTGTHSAGMRRGSGRVVGPVVGRGRLAFTLAELLVVIAISILLLAIAVPAFSAVLYNSRRAGASSSLQSALAAARDVAIESGPGRDAAAVFFADPGGGIRIMVAVYAGDLADRPSSGRGDVRREVFVRSDRVEPITLPGGWAVSGRARANTITDDWYESTYPASFRNEEHWVYPETALYQPDQRSGDAGRNRQTFMVRFEGGSGGLTYGNDAPVLVLDPAPTRAFRGGGVWSQHAVLDSTDHRRFVQRVLSIRGSGAQQQQTTRRLLGDESSDTVLARPVGQVAVYSMRQLARGVGAGRLNGQTNSLYLPALPPNHDRAFDGALFGGSVPADLTRSMNRWISGQAATPGEDADPDVQVFTVQRYLGRPLEAVAIGEAP